MWLCSCGIFISISTWTTWSEGGYEVCETSEPSQNVLGGFTFLCGFPAKYFVFVHNFTYFFPIFRQWHVLVWFMNLFVVILYYGIWQLIRLLIAVSKFSTKWQEYPDMDEGWMEQAVWFGICSVFDTAASTEVIIMLLLLHMLLFNLK